MHVHFGKTGLTIPRVVFGTTCLGNLFVEIPYEQKQQLIEAWFREQQAPVAIDAAGKYGAGMALEILGRELERLEIRADQVVLNNKLGWRQVPLSGSKQSFEPDAWKGLTHDAVQDISYDGIMRCCDQGCKLLGKYRPSFASIHDPDDYLDAASDVDDRNKRLNDIIEGYRALNELKESGQVVAIGVGAKQWRCIQMLHQHCDFDWIMFANSFTIMNHSTELISYLDHLKQLSIGVINSALFQGGFLVGGDLYDYRKLDPADPQDVALLAWREKFQRVCAEFETTPFLAALDFGSSHPAIHSVALSTSHPSRVADLVRSVMHRERSNFWNALLEENLISYTPNER